MCAAGAELLIPQRMELAIGENLVTGVTTEAAVVPELSSETEPNPSDQLMTSITFVECALDVALLAEQTVLEDDIIEADVLAADGAGEAGGVPGEQLAAISLHLHSI